MQIHCVYEFVTLVFIDSKENVTSYKGEKKEYQKGQELERTPYLKWQTSYQKKLLVTLLL